MSRAFMVLGMAFALVSFSATFSVSARADEDIKLMLPIGPIYDQGSTGWCWAYSAFHTLRTYLGIAPNDQDVVAWRAVVDPLDSADDFKGFLGDHWSTSHAGDPQDLIGYFQAHDHLPDMKWKVYYSSDHQSERLRGLPDRFTKIRLPAEEVMEKVHEGLECGIPSSYCDKEHCTMIYGETYDGTQVKEFAIADSEGGRTYLRARSKLIKTLDLVMTLR